MSYLISKYHGAYNIQRRTGTIRYIVLHYVGAGTSAAGSARANCVYFAGGNRNASAHYFVDDGSIYEYADPSAYATWHCGDGSGKYGITNQNSIGIEVCVNGNRPYTDSELPRVAFLVKYLQDKYGVPDSRVVRHYDASRKACPYYYTPYGSGGNPAWSELRDYVTGSAPEPSGIEVDGLWGSDTTLLAQKVVGAPYLDGRISRQPSVWRSSLPGCTIGWEWMGSGYGSGSQTIARLQEEWGATPDGFMGRDTINAMIAYYMRRGSGATVCDGKLDRYSKTIAQFQRELNAGRI